MAAIRRREFISLLGGAAAVWPLAARAQQPAKLPTIGLLGATTPAAWSLFIAAFVRRLRELGWIEGRTIAIEYRWAEGRGERFAEIAAEFVRLKVDVIVTAGGAVLAAKQATSLIPIVFAVAADPLGGGLVASLARPGGNATGLSMQASDAVGKRLESTARTSPRSASIGDHRQRRLSRRRAGNSRGSGNGPHARPRGHHIGNPASRGYRARL